MSRQQPRLSWGHININVSNLDQSIDFYRKLGFEVFLPSIPYLGLTMASGVDALGEGERRALALPKGTTGRACIMQLDDGFPKLDLTELTELAELSGEPPRPPLANRDLGLVRLCLASADLQRDYAALVARGVEFLAPPESCNDGLADVAVCRDPDGTLIELIQVHLQKWSAHLST